MAGFRTSSRMGEMVSFALRFVSWLPRGRNKPAIADMAGGTFGENRLEMAKEPARLAGPGRAR
ncbi:hypothetical protein QCM77_22065 [Bradyrhizobium sp. SSUT18]|uniref:hypothetical protein n=1 Tax=unclassified Bradyrhizobium TaxID=2631580 RepID=UPI00244A7E21|nr:MULTISPECIES: hypothetical protein [unclassified Bradyrhizobium]MDH2342293.1 hypothetical protein [Bradyrhizobium sp. SSUT77]MDH2353168.1 hypothetical protein [Bradyrhizobium sp. SSUT112]MDH2402629.1 hypothetical protein [Bradyrhizobium sp. SSUT18]